MKQLLTKIGMALLFMLSFQNTFAKGGFIQYDFEVDGIYYQIVSKEKMTCGVTYGEKEYVGNIVIPENVCYDGKEFVVTQIGDSTDYQGHGAFSYCYDLLSVSIPNTVKKIKGYSFSGCRSLLTLDIPDSVTEIEAHAFSSCENLETIKLPKKLKEISHYLFTDCVSLSTIKIPDSVNIIRTMAFDGCISLTKITIPASVKTIRELAFQYCTSLKTLIFEESDQPIIFELSTDPFDKTEEYLQFYLDNILDLHLGREIQLEKRYGKLIYGFSNLYKLSISDNVTIDKRLWNTFKSLYELTMGGNVSIPSCESKGQLRIITLTCSAPPVCPEFSSWQYENINVYVPKGSLATYMAADGWKNFWNLQESEKASSVEDISEARDIVETGRFDINGMPVDKDYKGIVIIRYSDGSTVKRIVR